MTDFIARGPAPATIQLECGPLNALLEPETAFLRHIRLGEHEILRGIYVAVRDQKWDTISAQVSNQRISHTAEGLLIGFDVHHRNHDRTVDFLWTGSISLTPDGKLSYAMDGTAQTTFLRNRIGFCVLHPHTAAGKECIVEKTDGSRENGRFPVKIAPHQPFKEMKSIGHEVVDDVRALIEFEGDIFEMEDHRNWTDASYKTYCTPLSLPFPVEVHEGTRIIQKITVSLEGDDLDRHVVSHIDSPIEITIDPTAVSPLPDIGVGMSSLKYPPHNKSIDRLQALRLAHLRVDLNLTGLDWHPKLIEAYRRAQSFFTRLEVALFFSDALKTELPALLDSVRQIKPEIVRWLVYRVDNAPVDTGWIQTIRAGLRQYDDRIPVISGSNVYFTDLNRNPPPLGALDGICYSLNPQVHTFDNASLVETLEIQGITARNARELGNGLPVVVSPVTLRPRFNPNATDADLEPEPDRLPDEVDPRQTTLFAAGWTMGSMKYLAEARADSITYYETTGWRGLMESVAGSPLHFAFNSIPGSVFPLYHVFADVREFDGGNVVHTRSAEPRRVESLALVSEGKGRILIANLAASEVDVRIEMPAGWQPQRLRIIDETEVLHAMRHSNDFRLNAWTQVTSSGPAFDLRLLSHAYACVDVDVTKSR